MTVYNNSNAQAALAGVPTEAGQASPLMAPAVPPSTTTPSAAPTTAAPANGTPAAAGATALTGSFDNEVPEFKAAPSPYSDFAQKIGQAADKLGIPRKANGQPQPGGWARSLVGAAQSVLSGFGDVATDKAQPGAGIFSGFAKAQANRTARIQEQKKEQQAAAQRDLENQREQQRMDMEQKKFDLDMTDANLRFQHQQRLNYITGTLDPAIEQGKKTIDMLTDPKNGHPVPVVAKDLTGDQIKQGVIDGRWNLHQFTAFPTGKKVVGTAESGDPLYATTYTLVNAQGKVTPTDDEIKYLNDNKATETPIQPGQQFTFAQWANVHQRADDVASATAARDKFLIDNKQTAAGLEKVNFGPDWVNALANNGGDPIRAYNAIMANPNLRQKYPNLLDDIKQSTPGFDKIMQDRFKQATDSGISVSTYLNNPDKMSGDNADTAIAAADEALQDPNLDQATKAQWAKVKTIAKDTRTLTMDDKKKLKETDKGAYMGDTSLSGAAYLATVPAPSRGVVKQIGDGQMPVQNMAYLLSRNPELAQSVTYYNPDFDGAKAKGYADLMKDFTDSKATGGALVSMGATMRHLKELYNDSTWDAFIPGRESYNKRQADLADAKAELARYLAGGKQPTETDKEDAEKSLSGWALTPTGWKAGIVQQAKLIREKYQEYKTRWDQAAPSDLYRRPMPTISPAATDDMDYILNGGKTPDPNAPVMLTDGQYTYSVPRKNVQAALSKNSKLRMQVEEQ